MDLLQFHVFRAFESLSLHEGSTVKMVCGAFYLPKDNPFSPRGEDAYFVCEEKRVIGVADGVGGWAKKGVDAGEYARQLMYNAFLAVINQQPVDGVGDLKSVLNEAFLNTKAKGSSTACIAMLSSKDNILYSINVGDSGFMVFRANRLAYQSPIQQYSFNFPFQLGNSETCDRPSIAAETSVPVVPGDIVVLGTDGLLDNVFPEEIEDVLNRQTLQGVYVNPSELALSITNLAWKNSLDRNRESPFAIAAQSAGLKHVGGKKDDISVVVAHIVPQKLV
ncbi:probable protein phosphatase 2C 80 [Alnus glutinosa]|uniref:probable protein phosphatase 2C 80 n=1 Tax=Alnus glutinosa TaxID=3517 RepID=UPI002D79B61F|nr:probable protein phosphatase 2C 80 [Alnus glutinosa]